jgi:hypothetical protein
MKNTLIVGALSLYTFQSFALPGFVKAAKYLHPDLNVNCTTCHAVSRGQMPANTNATDKGKSFYQEIKNASKGFERTTTGNDIANPDFIVLGDTRSNDKVHQAVVDKICAEKPQAVLHTGDVVANGGDQGLWDKALKIEKCLIDTKLLQHTCGNHEGKYCVDSPLRKALGNTKHFYQFDFKGFTFIALDSEEQSNEQLKWLRSLPVGKKYIPFYHHIPYPTISGHDADQGVVDKFVPEFERLGVKLSFNGHNHGYDRAEVDGAQYVTVGGGGAPLYPCGPEQDYTKACLSDYSYLKCAVGKGSNSISCVSIQLSRGAVVDSFTVKF